MYEPPRPVRARVLLVALLVGASNPRAARPACNLIPQRSTSFAGVVGVTNRPFSAPGETVEVSLRRCDASPGFSAVAGDQVVTLLFTPTGNGPRTVVVLATDCASLSTALQTCGGTQGVSSAVCRTVAPGAALAVRTGGRALDFRFPDTDDLVETSSDRRTLTGPATIAVSRATDPLPCQLATNPC